MEFSRAAAELAQGFSTAFTADVSTEGADRKFLFWDVSKEFPISLSVLHRFT
jgi:hypothetical protein